MNKKFIRVKRPRPSVQDAEAFLRGRPSGIWKSDYVSARERVARITDLRSNLGQVLKKHFPSDPRLDFSILKGHLLVDFMLTEHICLRSYYEYDVSAERLSFVQKLAVAHMLGFPLDPTLMPSLEILNRLRNQVAHGFEFDRFLVDRFLHFHAEDPCLRPKLSDRDRARKVRQVIFRIAWGLLGVIEGQHGAVYEERHQGA